MKYSLITMTIRQQRIEKDEKEGGVVWKIVIERRKQVRLVKSARTLIQIDDNCADPFVNHWIVDMYTKKAFVQFRNVHIIYLPSLVGYS